MQYNIVSQGGRTNLTAVIDGEMYVADDEHPAFTIIMAKVLNNDESVVRNFDATTVVADKVHTLTDRVVVRNGRVFVDQTEVGGVFADRLAAYVHEDASDADWGPLVLFLEKAFTNVEQDIRNNLSRWLAAEQFTLLPDGNILGYRGVTSALLSKNAGPGYVNGVAVNGPHDNTPGNVVSIDAEDVEHNPHVGCASGLHVGTYAYASSWAGSVGKVVSVSVDPRHVRSVPYECESAKMRVSQYKVLEVVDAKDEGLTATTAPDDDDDLSFDDPWADPADEFGLDDL